jgi:predicted enzyme related to lactoylglutathione lyase
MSATSKFIWYEVMTSDPAAAEAFYKTVVGWTPEAWSGGGYTILKAGENGVGGIMAIPEDAKAMGAKPCWLGYIYASDTDAATEKLRKAGGSVLREPSDIPEIGRFAVVADPHGATFMIMTPIGEERPPVAPDTLGHAGWRELYAGNLQEALDFYNYEFGWTAGDAIDMGPMGTYQLVSTDGGEPEIGMMTKPEQIPVPMWVYYFNVEGIDAAAARVTDNGGQVLNGPMEVPGGSWIIQCMDPQGAMFALSATRR